MVKFSVSLLDGVPSLNSCEECRVPAYHNCTLARRAKNGLRSGHKKQVLLSMLTSEVNKHSCVINLYIDVRNVGRTSLSI